MRKIIIALVVLLSANLTAQIHSPVKWNTNVVKISDFEFDLVATAIIEGEWHLYSQTIAKGGPAPTTFTFESNFNYLKKGNTKEEEGHIVNDKIFYMRIKCFDEKATFKQRIKIKNSKKFEVKGVVEFMVCNDSQCLPPKEVNLVFRIPE